MKTVGILGAGQLARMLILAGAPLGLKFKLYDPTPSACASTLAAQSIHDYDDLPALAQFASGLDSATLDFENVPAATLQTLSKQIPVFPNANALSISQDRLSEKTLFGQLDIETPEFRDITSKAVLQEAVDAFGYPCVLKTRRMGYDGKGQSRIKEPADVDLAWKELGASVETTGLILESWVPFEFELSMITARSGSGEIVTWPLTRNLHHNGVLIASIAPAHVDDDLQRSAEAYSRRLAEHLDYVGVMALELFCVKNHDKTGYRLIANEMAPRVHNSGHWTIEGSETSQFENHWRAGLDLPLGATCARGVSCMLNWLGELPDVRNVCAVPGAHWHDYGKTPREGRKVGHTTLRADTRHQLKQRVELLSKQLSDQPQLQSVIAMLSD